MSRNKVLAAAAWIAIAVLIAVQAESAGNPFMGAQQPKVSQSSTATSSSMVKSSPALPPPMPSAAMPMSSPYLQPTSQTAATKPAKSTKWRVLGKMGDDQVALQSDADEVLIHRDGNYIDDCYVLFPEIACEDSVISALKSKRNASMTLDRLKTELEIERTNSVRLKKQLETATANKIAAENTIVKQDAVITGQAEKIRLADKKADEVKSSLATVQAQLAAEMKSHAQQVIEKDAALKQQGSTIATQAETLKVDEVRIASLKASVKSLQAKIDEAKAEKQQLLDQLVSLKKQPAQIVEKVVYTPIPEWMKGDYYDATISGVAVGLRKTSSAVIIRVPIKDWKSVSGSIDGKYSSDWEDGTHRYAIVKQGNFNLAPPVKEAVN